MDKALQAQAKLRSMGIEIPDDVAKDFWNAMVVESNRRHFRKDGSVILGPYLPKLNTRAVGLSQILPATARSTNPNLDPYNEIDNIALGMQFFAQLDNPDKRISGDPIARRLAYFGGPNAQKNVGLRTYLQTGQVPKTRAYSKGSGVNSDTTWYDYVKKGMGFQGQPDSPGALGGTPSPSFAPPPPPLQAGEIDTRGPVLSVKPVDAAPPLPARGGGIAVAPPPTNFGDAPLSYRIPSTPEAFPQNQPTAPAVPEVQSTVRPRTPIPTPPPLMAADPREYQPLPDLEPVAPVPQPGAPMGTPITAAPRETYADDVVEFTTMQPEPAVEQVADEGDVDVTPEGVQRQAQELSDPVLADKVRREFNTVEDAVGKGGLGVLWIKPPLNPDGTVNFKDSFRDIFASNIFSQFGIKPEDFDGYAEYQESLGESNPFLQQATPTENGKFGFTLGLNAVNTILWGRDLRTDPEGTRARIEKDQIHPVMREWFSKRQIETLMGMAYQTQRLSKKRDPKNPFSGLFQGPDWVEEMPDEATYRAKIDEMVAEEPNAQKRLKEQLFAEEFAKEDPTSFRYWFGLFSSPLQSGFEFFSDFVRQVRGDEDAKSKHDLRVQRAQSNADARYGEVLKKHGAATAYYMLQDKLENLPTGDKAARWLSLKPKQFSFGFMTPFADTFKTVGIGQAMFDRWVLGKDVRPENYPMFQAGAALNKTFKDWAQVSNNLDDQVMVGVGNLFGFAVSTAATGGFGPVARGAVVGKGFLGQADDIARTIKVNDLLTLVKSNPALVERALVNANVAPTVIERVLDPQRFAKMLNAIGWGQARKVEKALIKGGYGDEVRQVVGASRQAGRISGGVGMAQMVGQGYTQAVENGASPDQALLVSLLVGPLGMLERVTPQGIVARLTRIQTLDKATNGEFSKGIAAKFKTFFGERGGATLKAGGQEFFTEFLQSLGQPTIEKLVTQKSSLEGFAKDFDNALYAGQVGFLVGAIAGGAGEFVDAVTNDEIKDPEGNKGGIMPPIAPDTEIRGLLPPAPPDGGGAAPGGAGTGTAGTGTAGTGTGGTTTPGGAGAGTAGTPPAGPSAGGGTQQGTPPADDTAAGAFNPNEVGPGGITAGQTVFKTIDTPRGPTVVTGQVSRSEDGGWQVDTYTFPTSPKNTGQLVAEPWSDVWSTNRPLSPNEQLEQQGESEERQMVPAAPADQVSEDIAIPLRGTSPGQTLPFQGRRQSEDDGSTTVIFGVKDAKGERRDAVTEGPLWGFGEFEANMQLDPDVREGFDKARADFQEQLNAEHKRANKKGRPPQAPPVKVAIQQINIAPNGRVIVNGVFMANGKLVPRGQVTFGATTNGREVVVPPSALQPRQTIRKLSNAAPTLTPGITSDSVQGQQELVDLMLWEATQDYNAAVEDYNAVLELYQTGPSPEEANAQMEAEAAEAAKTGKKKAGGQRKVVLSTDDAKAALRRKGTWRDIFAELEQNLVKRRTAVIDAARRMTVAVQAGRDVATPLSPEDAAFEQEMLAAMESAKDKDLSLDWVLRGLERIRKEGEAKAKEAEAAADAAVKARQEAEEAGIHPENAAQLEKGGKPRTDLRVGDPVISDSTGLTGVIVPPTEAGPILDQKGNPVKDENGNVVIRQARKNPMVEVTTKSGNIVYRDPVTSDFRLDLSRPIEDLKREGPKEKKRTIKDDITDIELADAAAKEREKKGLDKRQLARLEQLRTIAGQTKILRSQKETSPDQWLDIAKKLVEQGVIPKGEFKNIKAAYDAAKSRKKKDKGIQSDVGFAVSVALNKQIDTFERIDPKQAAAAKRRRQKQAAEIIAARKKAPAAEAPTTTDMEALESAREAVASILDRGGDVGDVLAQADKLVEQGLASQGLETTLFNLPDNATAEDIANAVLDDIDDMIEAAAVEPVAAPAPEPAPEPAVETAPEPAAKAKPAKKKAETKPTKKKAETKPAKKKAAPKKKAATTKAAAKPAAVKPTPAKPAKSAKAAKPAVSPEQQRVNAAVAAKETQIAEMKAKLSTAANQQSRDALQRKIDFAEKQLKDLQSGKGGVSPTLGDMLLDDIRDDIVESSREPVDSERVEEAFNETDNFSDFAERMNLWWEKVTDPKPKASKPKKAGAPKPALALGEDEAPVQIIFAPSPTPDGGFNNQSTSGSMKVGTSIYRFEVMANGEARFSVDENPEAQKQALLHPERNIQAVSTELEYRPDGATRVYTVEPGRARLEGGKWVVTQKAKVQYSPPTAKPTPETTEVATEPAAETTAEVTTETQAEPQGLPGVTTTPQPTAPKAGKRKGPPEIPGVDYNGNIYDPLLYNDYLSGKASKIIERGLQAKQGVDEIMKTIEKEVGFMRGTFHDTLRRYVELRVDARDNPRQEASKPLTGTETEVESITAPTPQTETSTQGAASALTPTQIAQIRRLKAAPESMSDENIANMLGVTVESVKSVPAIPPVGPNGQGVYKIRTAMEEDPDIFAAMRKIFGKGIDFSSFQDGLNALMDRIAQDPLVNKQRSSLMTAQDWQKILDAYGEPLGEAATKAILYGVHFQSEWNQAIEKFLNDPEVISLVEGLIKNNELHNEQLAKEALAKGEPAPPLRSLKWADLPTRLKDKLASVYERSKFGLTTHPFGEKATLPIISFTQYGVAFDKVLAGLMGETIADPIPRPPIPDPEKEVGDPEEKVQIIDDGKGGGKAVRYAPNAPVLENPMQANKELLVELEDGTRLILVGTPTQYPALPKNVKAILDIYPHGRISERGFLRNVANMVHGIGYNFAMGVDGQLIQGVVSRVAFEGLTADELAQELQPIRAFYRMDGTTQDEKGFGSLPSLTRDELMTALIRGGTLTVTQRMGGMTFDRTVTWDDDMEVIDAALAVLTKPNTFVSFVKQPDMKSPEVLRKVAALHVLQMLPSSDSVSQAIERAYERQNARLEKLRAENAPDTLIAKVEAEVDALERLWGEDNNADLFRFTPSAENETVRVTLVPDMDDFLDWDKRWDEQSEKVQLAVLDILRHPQHGPKFLKALVDRLDMNGWDLGDLSTMSLKDLGETLADDDFDVAEMLANPDLGITGKDIFETLAEAMPVEEGGMMRYKDKAASDLLHQNGVHGTSFTDKLTKGPAARNFVIFSSEDVGVEIFNRVDAPITKQRFRDLRVWLSKTGEYTQPLTVEDLKKDWEGAARRMRAILRMPTHTVTANASWTVEDGVLYANQETLALFNAAANLAYSNWDPEGVFYGAYMPWQGIMKMGEGLLTIQQALENSGHWAEADKINSLYGVLDGMLNSPWGDGVLVVDDPMAPLVSALVREEELAHRADFRLRLNQDVDLAPYEANEAYRKATETVKKTYNADVFEIHTEVIAKAFTSDAERQLGLTTDEVFEILDLFRSQLIDAGVTSSEVAAALSNINPTADRMIENYEPIQTDTRTDEPGREAETAADDAGRGEVRGEGVEGDVRLAEEAPPRVKGLQRKETFNPARWSDEEKQAVEDAPPSMKKRVAEEIYFAKKANYEWNVGSTVMDVWNAPKSLASSFDLSAGGRQGLILGLATAHKGFAIDAFKRQIKALNDANYESFKLWLQMHPAMDLAEAAGLYLANISDEAITAREEQFMSRLFQQDRVFKSEGAEKTRRVLTFGVRKSEAAYTTYLDSLRIESFKWLADQLADFNARNGLENRIEDFEAIAKFVNSATGRGKFEGVLEPLDRAMPVLNAAFFSARYWKSRIDVVNPYFYATLPGGFSKQGLFVKGLVLRQMGKFMVGVGLILSLFALMGAEVEWDNLTDPRFLRVRYGNWSYDFAAGIPQHLRYFNRMVAAAIKKPDKESSAARMGYLTERYVRGRLSPTSAMFYNYFDGQNFIGEPTTFTQELIGLPFPIGFEQLQENVKGEGLAGAVKGMPEFFGIGTSRFPLPDEYMKTLRELMESEYYKKNPQARKTVSDAYIKLARKARVERNADLRREQESDTLRLFGER